jgi:transcriptional regulator with XRE-family HTH domain
MLMGMDYDSRALGKAIRGWRLEAGLTQEELGRAAGYGRGAAVSVSRIEAGLTHPTPERFDGLAVALGRTPHEVREAAGALSEHTAVDDGVQGRLSDRESTKARFRRVQDEFQRRSEVTASLGDGFDRAHERAREDFFMPFVRAAGRINGAPQPNPAVLEAVTDVTASAEASLRLRVTRYGVASVLASGAGGAAAGAALGGAAAYGTLMAAVSFGAASTGAAISGLSGVAATNAALALLGGGTLAAGGAGVAGGALVLGGLVAAPVMVLAITGALLALRRNRRQQTELTEKLNEADRLIAESARSFDALVEIVSRATALLDYIAVHGSHALRRWASNLGDEPTDWWSLRAEDRERYQEFVEIAASQLALLTIGVQDIMTSRDEDLDEIIAIADAVLVQSLKAVEIRV